MDRASRSPPRYPKARLWTDGRKALFERMRRAIDPEARIIWIHVASLGEFEQDVPLSSRSAGCIPNSRSCSPSSPPRDTRSARTTPERSISSTCPSIRRAMPGRSSTSPHPEIAIFVKYEFWLNLLAELKRRKVRTYVVSAIFRRNSVFFRPYGGMWRQALEAFDTMFVQNEESKKLLATPRIRQRAGGRRHPLRPRGRDRPGRQAHRSDRPVQGRRTALRGRLHLGPPTRSCSFG